MNIVIGTSIGSAILTYEIIALFGYLTFGSHVGANIIAMYPSTSLFIAVGQLAIVVLILFSYPLQLQPCRISLDKIIYGERAGKPSEELDEDGEAVDDHDANSDMSMMKHTLLTGAIVAFGFMLAYNVDDLKMGKWVAVIGTGGGVDLRGQFCRLWGRLDLLLSHLSFRGFCFGR